MDLWFNAEFYVKQNNFAQNCLIAVGLGSLLTTNEATTGKVLSNQTIYLSIIIKI